MKNDSLLISFCFYLGDLLQKNIKGGLMISKSLQTNQAKVPLLMRENKYFVSPVELVDNAGQGSFQHDMLKV